MAQPRQKIIQMHAYLLLSMTMPRHLPQKLHLGLFIEG